MAAEFSLSCTLFSQRLPCYPLSHLINYTEMSSNEPPERFDLGNLPVTTKLPGNGTKSLAQAFSRQAILKQRPIRGVPRNISGRHRSIFLPTSPGQKRKESSSKHTVIAPQATSSSCRLPVLLFDASNLLNENATPQYDDSDALWSYGDVPIEAISSAPRNEAVLITTGRQKLKVCNILNIGLSYFGNVAHISSGSDARLPYKKTGVR